MRIIAALALVLATACAHQQPALVGTWRLVEYWNQPRDQPRQYPFGEHPAGFIVYDRTGHVFVQIARDPALKPLSPKELAGASREELRDTLGAFVAYFGTYTIDASRGVVTHHVEGDVRREYTGSDQERPFQLAGDELRIGDGKTWLRRLVRVR